MGLRLLFVGCPGSGKGTQAALFNERDGLAHLATGDIFRAEMADGTQLGNLAQGYIAKGELVPDKVTISMIEGRIRNEEEAGNGYILDGFPRSVTQAEATDAILRELGVGLDAAILFEIGESVVIERMQGRGRKDDTSQIIRKRLEVFRDETEPVVRHYEAQGLLRRVDADQSEEDVYAAIQAAIGK